MNIKVFGSPTLSDQALLRCDSIKIGPGDRQGRIRQMNLFTWKKLKRAIQLYPELIKNYIALL
jgi:acetylornithine deacetylase